jgi:hypothetical protein
MKYIFYDLEICAEEKCAAHVLFHELSMSDKNVECEARANKTSICFLPLRNVKTCNAGFKMSNENRLYIDRGRCAALTLKLSRVKNSRNSDRMIYDGKIINSTVRCQKNAYKIVRNL